jgi:broad specificity phosphatase PhoE
MASQLAALWLLRHGQSEGNVRREEADRLGAEALELDVRDMDVPLSDLGRRQAISFGTWLGGLAAERRPDVVVTSPYRRAYDTARHALRAAGWDEELIVSDERLREREFGILDLLTRRGIEQRFPEEARRRTHLGKFYYRPPGGESWVDVALRLRSLSDSLSLRYRDRRVLVVAHEVPIYMMRFLIEDLDERAALALGRDQPLANCGLTTYERDLGENQVLDMVNWTAPLEQRGTPVTEEPDAPVAPR